MELNLCIIMERRARLDLHTQQFMSAFTQQSIETGGTTTQRTGFNKQSCASGD